MPGTSRTSFHGTPHTPSEECSAEPTDSSHREKREHVPNGYVGGNRHDELYHSEEKNSPEKDELSHSSLAYRFPPLDLGHLRIHVGCAVVRQAITRFLAKQCRVVVRSWAR